MKTFDELIEKQRVLDEELKEKGKLALAEVFEDFFNQHREVLRVRWTQYTPYFNDGDPCYFGVNELEVLLSDADNSEDFQDSYDLKTGGYAAPLTDLGRALQEMYKKFSSGAGEKMLEKVFGDHVEVTVIANHKISVSYEEHEYSHD